VDESGGEDDDELILRVEMLGHVDAVVSGVNERKDGLGIVELDSPSRREHVIRLEDLVVVDCRWIKSASAFGWL